MGSIVKIEEVPMGENIYLKKDFLGWRVVEPWKDENGKINWFNFIFGGKRAILITVIILIIAVLLYLGVLDIINSYKAIANNPCNFCETCAAAFKNNIVIPKI